MKRKILSEINRVREIMGFNYFLTEVTGGLLKAIMKYAGKEASAAAWFIATKKALSESKVYSKMMRKGKIPFEKIINTPELIDALELILSKQNKLTLIGRKGASLGDQLRLAGFDVTDEIALRIGKEWDESINLNRLLDNIHRGVMDIEPHWVFSRTGNVPHPDVKPLIEVMEEVFEGRMIKDTGDLRAFFTEISLDPVDIEKFIKRVNSGLDISQMDDIHKIFSAMLEDTNYRKQIFDAIKTNPAWKELVQEHGWTIESVAGLLGREGATDPLVKSLYQELLELTWFQRWVKQPAIRFVKSKTAKVIFKVLFYGSIGGALFNYLLGRVYLRADKQREALSPQIYSDIMTNKELVKDQGGWTDDEAIAAALKINQALEGKGQLLGTADQMMEDVWAIIPTILASSQVTYWWQEKHGPGTLIKALEGLQWSPLISKTISSAMKDFTIDDIYDEIKTKKWCLTCTAKGKHSAYKAKIKASWPRYQKTLESDNGTLYYTRVSGPMDVEILGYVLEYCNANTGKDMDSCLLNITPQDFNAAWNTKYPEGVNSTPPYSPEYEGSKVQDMTEAFEQSLTDFLDSELEGGEGQSVLDGLLNKNIN